MKYLITYQFPWLENSEENGLSEKEILSICANKPKEFTIETKIEGGLSPKQYFAVRKKMSPR